MKTMEDKNLTDMVKTKDPESSQMTKPDHVQSSGRTEAMKDLFCAEVDPEVA